MKNLESILKLLGSKNPFLKQARITKNDEFVVLSTGGERAYEDLMYIIYGLENIGVLKDANKIIDKLDMILEREVNKRRGN